MQTFKTYSSPFGSQIQLPVENEEWLFLAQHHGIPTRLLDWSGNALIALFFAVVGSPESNGELWSLNYEGLNNLSGAPRGVNLKYPNYNFLIEDVFSFHDEKENLRKELKIEEGVVKPLAAFPYSLRISRIERQSGCFYYTSI